MSAQFWKHKKLAQLSPQEWELLCDGCGLCCLVKLEDEDSGEVFNTSISCQQLNLDTCRCKDYNNRFNKAPACTKITINNIAQLNWLPNSCAYKRLYNNLDLLPWHPLLNKNKQTEHLKAISANNFAQCEHHVHPQQWQDFIIDFDG